MSLQGDVDLIFENNIKHFPLDFDGVPLFTDAQWIVTFLYFPFNRDICSPFDFIWISQSVFWCFPAMANIEGIGDVWEDNLEVREHARATGVMTHRPVGTKWCEPSRPNCVANALVLTPLLERMHDEEGYKLPILEDLKRQIAILYHRLGASPSEKVINTTAVELKKLCSFVKRRTNRLEVTKDGMNNVRLKMRRSFVFDMVFKGFFFNGTKLVDSNLYRIEILWITYRFIFL